MRDSQRKKEEAERGVERDRNQRVTQKVTLKQWEVTAKENPDGHSGSGATRKLNSSRGFRVGLKDTEWVRERSPSKVTVTKTLTESEREERVRIWREHQQKVGLRP